MTASPTTLTPADRRRLGTHVEPEDRGVVGDIPPDPVERTEQDHRLAILSPINTAVPLLEGVLHYNPPGVVGPPENGRAYLTFEGGHVVWGVAMHVDAAANAAAEAYWNTAGPFHQRAEALWHRLSMIAALAGGMAREIDGSNLDIDPEAAIPWIRDDLLDIQSELHAEFEIAEGRECPHCGATGPEIEVDYTRTGFCTRCPKDGTGRRAS